MTFSNKQFRRGTDLLKEKKGVKFRPMCEELAINHERFNNMRTGKQAVDPKVVRVISGRYPEFITYLKSPDEDEETENERLKRENQELIEYYEKKLLERDDREQTLKSYISDLKEYIEKLKSA